MKSIYLSICLVAVISHTTNASHGKITNQQQLGLMQYVFNAAYSKEALTDNKVQQECAQRNIPISPADSQKLVVLSQEITRNKKIADCSMVIYDHVQSRTQQFSKYSQKNEKTSSQQNHGDVKKCKRMVSDFIHAIHTLPPNQSDK